MIRSQPTALRLSTKRRLAVWLAVVVGAGCGAGVATADALAANGPYFNGLACCANREPGNNNFAEYLTGNSASVSVSSTCVQEHVLAPRNFFDNYECGSGFASDSLNGQSYDEPVCWSNASSSNRATMNCEEFY